MNAPLSEQRLAEILARAAAATPGPWELCPSYGADFYANLSGSYLRGVGTLVFGDGEDAAADREFVLHAAEDVRELAAEVSRLWAERHSTNEALSDAAEALRVQRDRIAELETYEQLSPQQCPKGIHSDWLVDSEYAHACPWCRIDDLGTAHSNAVNLIAGLECDLSAANARLAELEALTPAPIQTCRKCGAGYDLGQPCSACQFQTLMAAEQAKRPSEGALAEQRHLVDPLDHAFEALALPHPTDAGSAL
ncbi:hypothetical protein [Streptomyces sp. NPDC013740]|uniref:hypothetical protein n=1 Tax=Streptomyces sp. NPDC013740 TaxID=3364867 RepID=UPI0036F77C91